MHRHSDGMHFFIRGGFHPLGINMRGELGKVKFGDYPVSDPFEADQGLLLGPCSPLQEQW